MKSLSTKQQKALKLSQLTSCECKTTVSLMSLNIKKCVDCGKETPWKLDKNQPSLLIKGLKG